MTDLSIHRKNIETYELCERLIKLSIEDLHLGKAKGLKTVDSYLDIYYDHLERIKRLKKDYLKQNNLRFNDD